MEEEKNIQDLEEETKEESVDDKKDDLEDLALDKEVPMDKDELEDSLEHGDASEDNVDAPMESIIEVETEYNYRTLKYTNMYVIRVHRKSWITSLVITLLTFAATAYILIAARSYFYFAIIMGLLGLFMVYNMLTEERRIDKQLKKYFAQHSPLKQKFLVNEDKIRVIATVGEKTQTADYPWAYIQSIEVIPEYIFLFVNTGSPLVFDTKDSAFTKGTKEEFNAILKEQATLKPYKFYDKKFFRNNDFDIVYPDTLESSDEDKYEKKSSCKKDDE